MSDPEQQLKKLGLILPKIFAPVANYVPTVRAANFVFVAGQLPRTSDGSIIMGRVGDTMEIEEARLAAENCGLYTLAALKNEIGDLGKVLRVVRVMGLVNTTPDVAQQPLVINGFSDLMVSVFDEQGKHARVAYGVASLPGGAVVEIESLFEVLD
jgi:enamine deaminase RidA (YjgF/YER057c/UK114 family)